MDTGISGLVLSGHSLGGALAVLSASDLCDRFPIKAVITGGAPQVGDSTSGERNEPRSHIEFRHHLEQRIRDQYNTLSPDGRGFIRSFPWVGIPGAGTRIGWLIVIYGLYKFLSVFVRVGRRLLKDATDHGKDERYGWAIADCATQLNSQRWTNVSDAERARRVADREDWLYLGSSLRFKEPFRWGR